MILNGLATVVDSRPVAPPFRISVVQLTMEPVEELLRLARVLDDHGFDALWLGEAYPWWRHHDYEARSSTSIGGACTGSGPTGTRSVAGGSSARRCRRSGRARAASGWRRSARGSRSRGGAASSSSGARAATSSARSRPGWRAGAARRVVPEDEWPEGVRVHADLELVEYLCPACGALHEVDVEERGAGPLQDVILAADAFAASARSTTKGAA
jgi:hypothetical protein